tara:strand:- start:176 stop:409 length:234 start_codon:yes stop_codon:yes gene_type:complete
MQTITKKFLEAQIERLNRETNNPPAHYQLSGAYGGYSLHRMGADVFGSGHISKRDLSARISAMMCGIDAAYLTTPRA